LSIPSQWAEDLSRNYFLKTFILFEKLGLNNSVVLDKVVERAVYSIVDLESLTVGFASSTGVDLGCQVASYHQSELNLTSFT
jgi:hypothetical protein